MSNMTNRLHYNQWLKQQCNKIKALPNAVFSQPFLATPGTTMCFEHDQQKENQVVAMPSEKRMLVMGKGIVPVLSNQFLIAPPPKEQPFQEQQLSHTSFPSFCQRSNNDDDHKAMNSFLSSPFFMVQQQQDNQQEQSFCSPACSQFEQCASRSRASAHLIRQAFLAVRKSSSSTRALLLKSCSLSSSKKQQRNSNPDAISSCLTKHLSLDSLTQATTTGKPTRSLSPTPNTPLSCFGEAGDADPLLVSPTGSEENDEKRMNNVPVTQEQQEQREESQRQRLLSSIMQANPRIAALQRQQQLMIRRCNDKLQRHRQLMKLHQQHQHEFVQQERKQGKQEGGGQPYSPHHPFPTPPLPQLPVHFPARLYKMLDEAEEGGYNHIISFSGDGAYFRVHDRKRFVSEIMPKWFNQSSFSSFHRQLNSYGFESVQRQKSKSFFHHPSFCRGSKQQSCNIPRKKFERSKSGPRVLRRTMPPAERTVQI